MQPSKLTKTKFRLIASTDHLEARNLIETERDILKTLVSTNSSAKKDAEAGLKFLDYLAATWMDLSMWSSWSQSARNEAALILGRDVDGILPTTNHLESFNNILKRKYIPQWQRSGKRLRFDVFIHHLVFKILPDIFVQRRMQEQYKNWLSTRFSKAAGEQLLQRRALHAEQPRTGKSNIPFIPIAWYEPSHEKDIKAHALFAARPPRLVPFESRRPFELCASCAATTANLSDTSHHRYWLTVHPTGAATCTCVNWLKQGGACKHLRAFRLIIESWIGSGQLTRRFHFPSSREESQLIQQRNLIYYGDQYNESITSPLSHHCLHNQIIGALSTSQPPEQWMDSLHRSNSDSSSSIILPPPPLAIENQEQNGLENQTLFQHIVGDDMQLDELHEDGQEISDTDGEIEILTGRSPDFEGLGASPTRHDSRHAIELQQQQRLRHDITKVLPMLHGISVLLDDAPQLIRGTDTSNLADICEFCDVVKDLHNRFNGTEHGLDVPRDLREGSSQKRSSSKIRGAYTERS